MRTLKLQMQISLDGYVASPTGALDRVVWNRDDALNQYVTDLMGDVDCILMGRHLAEGFIPHWTKVLKDSDGTDESAARMVNTPKVVFSKTLTESPREHTTIAGGNFVDEITQLKQQSGGSLITYGGATFASQLIEHALIDELHLFINPTAIGD